MKLVHLYFIRLNPLAPLLHRPTFERKIMQGIHLRNPSFGAVYLLVCAVASRYSDDPRVFLDSVESGIIEHSAGWKFFEQVQMVRRTLLGPPCLEDLQIYCVGVFFVSPSWRRWGFTGHSCLFCSCKGRRPHKRVGRSLG